MNKNNLISYIILPATIAFFCSCAGLQPGAPKPAPAPPPQSQAPVQTAAKTDTVVFDPMEFVDDGILQPKQIETVPVEKPLPVKSDSKIAVPPVPPAAPPTEERWEESSKPGFRVQIYATNSVDAARQKEKEALDKFTAGVYLIYDPPNYKVRIGNCQSRQEAEDLQKKAVILGYIDAWVVRDNIVVKIKVE